MRYHKIILSVFLAMLFLPGSVWAQEAEPPLPLVPPETTEVKSVLVLGDSHSMGHFGRVLHKSLRKRFPDAKVTLVAACGKGESGYLSGGYAHCGVITMNAKGRISRPKGCKKNPCTEADGPECSKDGCRPKKLHAYLRRHKPDIILFQLGGNSWFKGSLKRGWPSVEKHLKRIAKKLAKQNPKCLWITPSDHMGRDAASQDAFAAFYEEKLQGTCTVFNSRPAHRPYMDYAQGVVDSGKKASSVDGTHYGSLGAKGKEIQEKWVEDILLYMDSELGPLSP